MSQNRVLSLLFFQTDVQSDLSVSLHFFPFDFLSLFASVVKVCVSTPGTIHDNTCLW